MIKINIPKLIEHHVNHVRVRAHIRYPEDSLINDEPDIDAKMPFLIHNEWVPIIDISYGKIIGWWPDGPKAKIHYKVCDQFSCYFPFVAGGLFEYNGYVPEFMYPDGNGYGDYIKMTVDEGGQIMNWNKDLVKAFIEEQAWEEFR